MSQCPFSTTITITDTHVIKMNVLNSRRISKDISNIIMLRLSTNSSHINIFTQNKQDYESALKNCSYKTKLANKITDEMAVAFELGKQFF